MSADAVGNTPTYWRKAANCAWLRVRSNCNFCSCCCRANTRSWSANTRSCNTGLRGQWQCHGCGIVKDASIVCVRGCVIAVLQVVVATLQSPAAIMPGTVPTWLLYQFESTCQDDPRCVSVACKAAQPSQTRCHRAGDGCCASSKAGPGYGSTCPRLQGPNRELINTARCKLSLGANCQLRRAQRARHRQGAGC